LTYYDEAGRAKIRERAAFAKNASQLPWVRKVEHSEKYVGKTLIAPR
jgi:hypothetical protein